MQRPLDVSNAHHDRSTHERQRTISSILLAIKRSSQSRDLEAGRALHREAVASRLDDHKRIAASLITMYGKCGSMPSAQAVFNRMASRDVVSWNVLLSGYVENGESAQALAVFNLLDCTPNGATYVAALRACAQLASENASEKEDHLRTGVTIHKQVKESGFHSDLRVSNALIFMFSRCGCMKHAREILEKMEHRDTVTWNTLMLGYVDNEESLVAVEIFTSMNCEPSSVTYIAAFKACGRMATEAKLEKLYCLEKGLAFHMQLRSSHLGFDVPLENTIISTYMKLGAVQLGQEVFNRMPHRNVVSWNTLILGYAENGKSSTALELFRCMDCLPDSLTYVAGIKSCGSLDVEKPFCLDKLTSIHKRIKRQGLESDMIITATLLDVYGKLGCMHHAREVFNGTRLRNVYTWTALIVGYVGNGEFHVALELFSTMDCQPNSVTCTAALKSLAGLSSETISEKQSCLEKGVCIHKLAAKHGLLSDLQLLTTLIDMYMKCGEVHTAEDVFKSMNARTSVTWNTLIIGYVQNRRYVEAIEAFESMSFKATSVSYIGAMKACGGLASENETLKKLYLEKLVSLHKRVVNLGLHTDTSLATTLVDMYCKCGHTSHAKKVFDGMSSRTVVTWSSLVSGYVDNWEYSAALTCFSSMDCHPTAVTFTSVLQACGALSALRTGQHISFRIHKLGLERELQVGAALVDFYVKCGDMSRAEELFNVMDSPGVVAWTSLIAGYCSAGDSQQVVRSVKSMREAGLEMDSVTSVCVLAACSHGGLVEEGSCYFTSSGLSTLEHYNCMVDLLTRANKLQEALAFINSMPLSANTVTWMTLLAACRKWKDLKVGRAAFEALTRQEEQEQEQHGAAYVLWSDLLAGETENLKIQKKYFIRE